MGLLRYILLLIVFCSFTVPHVQRNKDLVLHLDLRKNQGKLPQDETGLNYCVGRGTTLVHERNSYRFSSGGTDEVDCGTKSPLNFTTQITFSVWIFMNSTITGIGKQTSGSSGFAYVVAYNTDNKVYFQMTGNGTTVTYGNTTTTYPLNQWVHVVCTYNGGGSTNANKMQIYINGIARSLTFVGTIPTSMYVTTANLRVNVLNGVTYGNGKMGLIRMFNSYFTPNQVWQEYLNTKELMY